MSTLGPAMQQGGMGLNGALENAVLREKWATLKDKIRFTVFLFVKFEHWMNIPRRGNLFIYAGKTFFVPFNGCVMSFQMTSLP